MFQNSCTIQLGISGFLFSIPPIAAKFQSPEKMGLQSQKNILLIYSPSIGVIWFEF
jgi:hypothetical protein